MNFKKHLKYKLNELNRLPAGLKKKRVIGLKPFQTGPGPKGQGLDLTADLPEALPAVEDSSNYNVNDLLDLISQWGPCPGCEWDLNGDGVVDVTDLLAVIAGWGSDDGGEQESSPESSLEHPFDDLSAFKGITQDSFLNYQADKF